MTKNIKYVDRIKTYPAYFRKEIFLLDKHEVFIDGGAYIGDTIKSFYKTWSKDKDHEFYLWECDKCNLDEIEKELIGVDYHLIPYGMWSTGKEKYFAGGRMDGSYIVDENDDTINRQNSIIVNSIDNVHGMDGILPIDKVTFIKMDIEGSEQHAIKGAKNIIKRDRPKLAISIYHKEEDLWKIPLMIKKMVPEYRLYIRHHSDTETDTVLYATI